MLDAPTVRMVCGARRFLSRVQALRRVRHFSREDQSGRNERMRIEFFWRNWAWPAFYVLAADQPFRGFDVGPLTIKCPIGPKQKGGDHD